MSVFLGGIPVKKRILAVLLALVLCLGLAPVVSLAADVSYPVTGGNLTFDLTTGTITGCGKDVTEAVIPAQIYDVPVTTIGDSAFFGCKNLTNVTIPDSVTTIGEKAFSDTGLTNVIIPEGVTEIRSMAFCDCINLLTASVPGSATSLGKRIFENCYELTSVTLGEGITELPFCMFEDCTALISVDLPQSLVTVGDCAFSGCYALQHIQLPDNVTSIGDSAFCDCEALEDIRLGSSLQTIGEKAFFRCYSLETIQLPDSVTTLTKLAFFRSGLTSISIPSSVTELSRAVFQDCESLKEIYLPDTITLINEDTFWGCPALTDIYYAGTVTQWADVDFQSDTTAAIHFNSTSPSPIGNTSAWAVSEIEKAAEMGLIPEALAGQDLTKSISRTEFAAVAVKVFENLSGSKAVPIVNNPFTDTKDVEVLKAYGIGAVDGTSATTFTPNALLNREQCATMLTRVFKKITLAGWTLASDSQFKLDYAQPAKFADDGNISDWAKDSVYFMVANGIIKGVGENKFAPKNTTSAEEAQGYANATREQALAIAVRMVENLK